MTIRKHRREGVQAEATTPGKMDLANPGSPVAGTQYTDEVGEVGRAIAPGKDFIPSEAGTHWQIYKQRAI